MTATYFFAVSRVGIELGNFASAAVGVGGTTEAAATGDTSTNPRDTSCAASTV